MPNDISLPAKVSAARVAALTSAVSDGTRRLVLPARPTYSSPLSVSLVTQAVLTWGTHPAASTVATDLDLNDPRAEEVLARNSPLLAATQLATTIETREGVNVTERVRAIASAALDLSSDLPQAGTGASVGSDRTIIAVDHVPDRDRPRGIYPRGQLDEAARPFFAGKIGMDTRGFRGRLPLGHRALAVGGQLPNSWGEKYAGAGSALGMILFELLQNTDIHARNTVYGKPLPRSVRLAHIRGIGQTRDVLARSEPANHHLMRFYSQAQAADGAAARDWLRFIVVSVIDSGPGLARTLLRRENIVAPSPRQEMQYFLRALRMTSSGSTREPMRGLGLRRVQTFVSALGGYARVRSGRYEVHRDFVLHPYSRADDNERAWYDGLRQPAAVDQLVGTAVTLVLPIPPASTVEELWRAAADGG